MNYSTSVMLINPKIRAVRGKYEDHGNEETFKTLDQSLKVDDLAVVESGTRHLVTTVKITAVDVDVDFDSPKNVGWVVQKIDMQSHVQVRVMEDAAIQVIKKGELRKRREDIKKNTLDAFAAGEVEKLAITHAGGNEEPPPDVKA